MGKLIVILLMEAELNFTNKLFIEVNIMKAADKEKIITTDQYGVCNRKN